MLFEGKLQVMSISSQQVLCRHFSPNYSAKVCHFVYDLINRIAVSPTPESWTLKSDLL